MGSAISRLDGSIIHLEFRRQYLHREAVTDGPFTPWYIRAEARWVKWRLACLRKKIAELRAQHHTEWPRESWLTVWRINRAMKEERGLRKKLGNEQ